MRRMLPLFLSVLFFSAQAQLRVTSMRIAGHAQPAGLPAAGFRFSWELASDRRNARQSAWEIGVALSETDAAARKFSVWHSPRTLSDQSVGVLYEGPALAAGTRYAWRVRVWDEAGRPGPWSAPQIFLTGLAAPEDWRGARWIGYEDLPDSGLVVPGVHFPEIGTIGDRCNRRAVVPALRKTFPSAHAIRSATLFVSGLGQYECRINGARVGRAFLAPGWTQYDKTVLYDTYDVTGLLRRGGNALTALVGPGFYYISRERYVKLVDAYGYPKLLARLRIVFADGRDTDIVSDASWKADRSPLVFSSIYGGEDYDARMENPGWTKPGFDDAAWRPAKLVAPPQGALRASIDYPVAVADSFRAKRAERRSPETWAFDFGQNASGFVRIRVHGKKGRKIVLTPSELLYPDGSPNQSASGEPYSWSYTCRGDGEEIWEPRFTYYGLRYVQVSGARPDSAKADADLPVLRELTFLHTRNSAPAAGEFSCSNKLFERIFTLIRWAIRSNLQSVVTDCPHREKLGWLEQDHLMGQSVRDNFEIGPLYRQIVRDMMDAQTPEGLVPDIAPEYVVFQSGFRDSPEWGSACAILPWLLWQWYGDRDILREAFPMVKRYIGYLQGKSQGQILSYGLGDWFDYGPGEPGESQLTPKSLTATALYYYDVSITAQMAGLLGEGGDSVRLSAQAASIRQAFNDKFFDASRKLYATGSQTSMAMPLVTGLVPEEDRAAVVRNLVASIRENKYALTTGDIGFHFLVAALDQAGEAGVIEAMNDRDDVPGYGFQLRKGATALTESWPALENVSNNHLMLGHIMEWFYSGLAGIGQQPGSAGFRHVLIRPTPVKSVDSVRAAFHSPYGWIRSAWTKKGDRFELRISIPVNCDAEVILPSANAGELRINGAAAAPGRLKVGAGTWRIEARL